MQAACTHTPLQNRCRLVSLWLFIRFVLYRVLSGLTQMVTTFFGAELHRWKGIEVILIDTFCQDEFSNGCVVWWMSKGGDIIHSMHSLTDKYDGFVAKLAPLQPNTCALIRSTVCQPSAGRWIFVSLSCTAIMLPYLFMITESSLLGAEYLSDTILILRWTHFGNFFLAMFWSLDKYATLKILAIHMHYLLWTFVLRSSTDFFGCGVTYELRHSSTVWMHGSFALSRWEMYNLRYSL